MFSDSSDTTTQLAFSLHQNKGRYALLIGSGVSRSAGIPTGWEITLDLIRRMARSQDVEDQSDWAAWYWAKYKREPNYSEIITHLAPSQDERRAILHHYIEPSSEDDNQLKKPTVAHCMIADLVKGGYIRVIITTNFDRLLENALRERGIEPTIVSSVEALKGAEPFTHSTCYILKLHGDYKDVRICNTDYELENYSSEYNVLLDRIFDEHGLLICGWSGDWDAALRKALMRSPNRRYSTYWAYRGPLSDVADQLKRQRDAKIVQISEANEFFGDLKRRLDALAKVDRPDPLNTDVILRVTKSLLGRPETRIELEDFISSQVERASQRLRDERFLPKSWSEDDFRNRIIEYQEITKPVALIVGLLGRWGDANELRVCTDILKNLYAQANEVTNGTVNLLKIRSYPAALSYYAIGIGLVRAGRLDLLYKFFNYVIPIHPNGSKTLLRVFHGTEWEGSYKEYFGLLPKMKKRETPFSDHVCEVIGEYARSYLSLTNDFEALFDRFEMLGALAHLQENDLSKLRSSIIQNKRFSPMPVGRYIWKNQTRQVIEELQSGALRQGALEAGFAKNDPSILELFIKNIGLRNHYI